MITGGASGIGLATAIRFAREGARVSIIDINTEAFDDIANSWKALNNQFNYFYGNVADPSGLESVITDIVKTVGDLNVVFANAGVGVGDLVADMPDEKWVEVINTNLNGAFYTCKYAIPSLIKQPGNAIVTMSSSMAGWDTSLQGAAYMASKEGVTGLTKSLALQLGRYGVRVNAVCPGVIDTPFSGSSKSHRKSLNEQFSKRIPLWRVGTPDDVAAVVAFFASDDARHVSGSMLLIDGGQTLQSWSNAPDAEAFPLDYDLSNN